MIEAASSFGSTALQAQSAATNILPLLLGGASTTAVLLVGFVGDVLIYRFINVPFPQNFIKFASNLYSNFIPNPYRGLESQYNIPSATFGKFQEYEMSSVLLGNSGNTLDRELYAIAVAILSLIGARMFRKRRRLSRNLRIIKNMYMWNIFLTYYMGDFTELILFSLLQLRENDCKGAYPAYSCSICYLIIFSYVILYCLLGYVLNRKPNPENSNPTAASVRALETVSGKVENTRKWAWVPPYLKIIISDVKQNSYYNRNYVIIMAFRNLLIVLILFLLQSYGTLQSILYILVELLYGILVLVVWKSFAQKTQTILFGIGQSSKVIIGILALVLGAIDSLTEDQRNSIGTATIALILISIIGSGIIAVITLIGGTKELWKQFKGKFLTRKNIVLPIPRQETETPALDTIRVTTRHQSLDSATTIVVPDTKESPITTKSKFFPGESKEDSSGDRFDSLNRLPFIMKVQDTVMKPEENNLTSEILTVPADQKVTIIHTKLNLPKGKTALPKPGESGKEYEVSSTRLEKFKPIENNWIVEETPKKENIETEMEVANSAARDRAQTVDDE